jgi:acetoin:2,6-dichlorophenolindophenol oxidoreductase subunit alpha
MRSPDLNVPTNIARTYPIELSLEMFAKMCLVRYFEKGVIRAVKDKKIVSNMYLSTGQESVAAALSMRVKDYQVFTQHRSHDIYLCFGASPEKLRDELMGLPSGTSQGKAGSNCLQCHEGGISIFGHHGLIGENVPQGVGAALGNGKKTLAVFGDGSAEEDYVLASFGFAASNKLPVLFICMDNDLSILTPVRVRRKWNIAEVARAFGMPAVDVADSPWAIINQLDSLTPNLPALINCRVCRGHWHAGIGIDGAPEWDRFSMVKKELIQLGQEKVINEIEARVQLDMVKLWND